MRPLNILILIDLSILNIEEIMNKGIYYENKGFPENYTREYRFDCFVDGNVFETTHTLSWDTLACLSGHHRLSMDDNPH